MGGGALHLRQCGKSRANMMGLNLAPQQVARHVGCLVHPPCLGARGHKTFIQQAGADAVGIDTIYPNPERPQLQRQLAQQKHGGGFGDAVSAKPLAGVDRLFGNIEQDLPAAPLGGEYGGSSLGKALMGKEIQLKTLSQGLVRHICHFATPGRSGVGDKNIKPAKSADTGIHRLSGRPVGCDIHGKAIMAHAEGFERGIQRRLFQINDKNICPERGKALRRGQPDRATAAGDHHHPALQRGGLALAQLGLLQRPVFHIKQLFG